MKERPILFNAAMVRAILSGQKTQTRRVVKPYEPRLGSIAVPADVSYLPDFTCYRATCPYGSPGDQLWVRESFWGCDAPGWGDQPCVVYDDEWHGKEYCPAEIRPWARKFGRIPSIHMPRDCSRIQLEITGVRVERLQDISEEDAEAEGCPECDVCHGVGWINSGPDGGWQCTANGCGDAYREQYARLWESINGPGSWDANPWIWVIEFKRIKP